MKVHQLWFGLRDVTIWGFLDLEQGWRTFGTRKDFLGTRDSLLPQFFISFARPASLHCEERVYIYKYLTAYRMYMNYRCYQIALRVKHFYTIRERCEVMTGYLSLGRRSGGDWANTWHWTERFTVFFSKRKRQQPQLLPNCLLIAFLEAFI